MSDVDGATAVLLTLSTALMVAFTIAVVFAIAVGGAPQFAAVDADHPLDSRDAVHEFEQTGHVSANVTEIDMQLTIAEDHETIDVDQPLLTDFNRRYVCMDYREEIPREVRVYVPAEYINPRTGESPSLTSEHTVTYDPAGDGEYTAVTVTFDGPARVCTGFTAGSGIYFESKRSVRSWLNNTTGFSPPSVASSPNWERVSPGAFGVNQTYRLPADRPLTIQYDTADGERERWITVPDCSDPSEQTVCQYREGDGSNESVVLLSTATDPPPIRYQYGGGIESDLRSAVRDARQAVDRFLRDVTGWVGGTGGAS